MASTYDVRVWRILVNKNKGGRTYTVRWITDGKPWRETFSTRALAESFYAELLGFIRKGLAFDPATGRPVEHAGRRGRSVSWWSLACSYVDHRWDEAAPNSRRSMADALATITLSLVGPAPAAPSKREIRNAVTRWAANASRRGSASVPDDLIRTVTWLERNTLAVSSLADEAIVLAVLKGISKTLAGEPAAATTIARKRAVLYNVLEYAVSPARLLDRNLLATIRWRVPKVAEEVSPRRVVNVEQAEALLAEVGAAAPRLKAFFASIYYSALRPAEAVDVTIDKISLPEGRQSDEWGWFYLGGSAPAVGAAWTNNGKRRESRGLKHRPRKAVRPVPIPPPLVAILRDHIAAYGVGTDGHVFVAARGGLLSESVYGRVWQLARAAVFGSAQAASPLAERPYDLRHACVSTWLNAGVPAPQVAEWAGHSVNVLLRVYAACIVGQDDMSKQRIAAALRPTPSALDADTDTTQAPGESRGGP
ncbi:tyrosine-type recombinase/integrase [Nonomuraea sp. NPDC049158]|uniref:tyrosine-type recombinase/integrase n=1 Tax=Nonomuraea sp. NPDC049158 TaxID=3155649 RepID=UPI0033E8870E